MASKLCTDMYVDEILQCSICMELIADPRALPCLHSYCYQCISNWCSGKRPGSQAECPLCRKVFVIPNGGLTNLQKNFFIANLLQLHQMTGAETTKKLCEVCGDVENEGDGKQVDKFAKMFCLECQQRMCKLCSTVHAKMKNSSSHKLVSLDEISSGGSDIYSKYQSLMCDKHADKKIEVFCFVCKTTSCMMCYIKDHSSHKCSEVAGDFRVNLKQDIQNMTKAIETYDTNLMEIKQNGIIFSNKAKEVENAISARADQLIAEIEAEKRKLITDLNATTFTHQKEILNATEEISLKKSLLQRSLNYYTEFLKMGSDVDVAREATSLHTRAEELKEVKTVTEALKDVRVHEISFSMSGLTYSQPESILGLILKKGLGPTLGLLAKSSPANAVVAIAILDVELFVGHANENAVVSVYDSVTLKPKRQIRVQGMSSSPNGLAACSTNKFLYVSDIPTQCVFKVDFSRTISNRPYSCYQTHWKLSRWPGQLSVTYAEHNVLVAYEGGGGIGEYSLDGTLIRHFFSNATIFHAVQLNNLTLGVCQLQPVQSIFISYENGCILKEFRDMPNKKCSLAADSYGNIIFPDKSNNRIQVVNSSLTSVRTLALPASVALKSPFAICYDQGSKRLYVGGGDDAPHPHESGLVRRKWFPESNPGFHLSVFDGVTF